MSEAHPALRRRRDAYKDFTQAATSFATRRAAYAEVVKKHGEQSAEAKKLFPALRTSETAYTKRRKELELRAVWSREEFLRERDGFLDDLVLVDDDGEARTNETGDPIPVTDLTQLHPEHQAAELERWQELSIFLAAYDRLAHPDHAEEFADRQREAQLAEWVRAFFNSVSRPDRSTVAFPDRNEDVLAMVAYIEREQKPEPVTPAKTEKQAQMRAKAAENRAKVAELIVAAVNEAQERLAEGLELTAVAEEALRKREAAAAAQAEYEAEAAARAAEKPKVKKPAKQVTASAPKTVEPKPEADTIDAAAQVLDLLNGGSRQETAEVVEEVEPVETEAEVEEVQVEAKPTLAAPPSLPKPPRLPSLPAPLPRAIQEEPATQEQAPLPVPVAPVKAHLPTPRSAPTSRPLPAPPLPAPAQEQEETFLEKFLKRMGLKP